VVADTCPEAGLLSTLAMLREREGEDFLAAQGGRYWVVR